MKGHTQFNVYVLIYSEHPKTTLNHFRIICMWIYAALAFLANKVSCNHNQMHTNQLMKRESKHVTARTTYYLINTITG